MKHDDILYICGVKGKDTICPVNHRPCWEDCYLVTNGKYAKNGECKDPENHPERFETHEWADGITYYEEKRGYMNVQ